MVIGLLRKILSKFIEYYSNKTLDKILNTYNKYFLNI